MQPVATGTRRNYDCPGHEGLSAKDGPLCPVLGQLLVLVLLATGGNVTVDAVYPDPATPGDAGEFVVLHVPEGASPDGLTLTDGEDAVDISDINRTGRIAVTAAPDVTSNVTDLPIHAVPESLDLRNGGEWVAIRAANRTISNLTYPHAHEAELYRDGRWTPLGRSEFQPFVARNVSTTAFVLPDRSARIDRLLANADERILLGGYTFSDPATARRLVDAERRGVSVRVLVEGGPVGGITTAEVAAVDRLRQAGIPIAVMGSTRERYDFHHAKYAVVDDTVLVTSENWKPGGTGGNGSRGWAVSIEDPALADDLATVFATDSRDAGTASWESVRPADPVQEIPDNSTFPARFAPVESRADRVSILLAPDNAATQVRSLLDQADESIWIQQVSIQRDGTLMNETLAAARRGVEVRILVSGAWFVEKENRRFIRDLRRTARREGLPIRVAMVEPRSRFEYVHAKGVIVDGRSAIVGSLNWNDHALYQNREVAVRVDDPEVATFYRRTFLADWRGAAWRVQWLLLVGAGFVVLGGLWFAWRVADFSTSVGERRESGLPPE